MRIGIDAREIQDGVHTGIGRALRVFLDFFREQDDEHRAVLFAARPLQLPDSDRIRTVVAPPSLTMVWDQITLARLIRDERITLFYSPYYKIPFRATCPCIATIYDLMYLTYPSYRQRTKWTRLYYATIARILVKKAACVVTGSRYSHNEIVSWYHLDPEAVPVIPLGVPSYFRPADVAAIQRTTARLGITGDYILYTGNFKPHKNVGALIEAFSLLRCRFPDLLLVLAGLQDHHFAAIAQCIEQQGLSPRVIAPGTVDDADLPALYAGARCFVMPSLYEGFGYPPLEAMACGVPVVCSNATSLPEVVGDAALMTNASDPAAIAAAVASVLESPRLSRSLADKGLLRARLFSEARYAGAVYDLLRRTGNGTGPGHFPTVSS